MNNLLGYRYWMLSKVRIYNLLQVTKVRRLSFQKCLYILIQKYKINARIYTHDILCKYMHTYVNLKMISGVRFGQGSNL